MNMTDLNLEENTLLQFFSFNDRKIMHLRWNRYTPSYMDFALQKMCNLKGLNTNAIIYYSVNFNEGANVSGWSGVLPIKPLKYVKIP